MKPAIPITDPRFKYTDAEHTDIRKTFERIRRELVEQKPPKPAANVTKLSKRRREPPIAGEAT